MPKLTTTLARIREHSPCREGYAKLLRHLGKTEADDAPIDLLVVLESNGVQDCLWCLRATVEDSRPVAVALAIRFAESVLHVFEEARPGDDRPRKAIEAAKRGGPAADAAWAAADAARAAYAAEAAYAAARAAYAADAADAADAAWAAYAAAYAATGAAACAAAYAVRAARAAQAEIIREILCDERPSSI